MKLPKTPAACADLLYTTRKERLLLQRQVDELQERETALKEFFINNLPKSQASGIAGKVARVQLGSKQIPQVADWSRFEKWVLQEQAVYLFQRRLNETAIKELWDSEITVPGVEKFNLVTVSCTAVKK
jgi:hypothetical protein